VISIAFVVSVLALNSASLIGLDDKTPNTLPVESDEPLMV